MHAVAKKFSVVLLGVALAACKSTLPQGVGQATQDMLPAVVQGVAGQGGQSGSESAQGGSGGALAQAAVGMLSGGGQSGASAPATSTSSSAVQPSTALANSNEISFFSKSGLEACGGGALAGVVTCKLTKTCDSKKGVAKAAVLGCGIGIGVNYYLDYQRGQYADSEQRLDALITDVKSDNQKLESLISEAQQVLSTDKNTLAQIQQGIKHKSVQKASAQSQLAQIDANTQTLTKTLTDLKSRHQQWQEVASKERAQGPKGQALDAEISRMQKQIVNLEQNVNSVAQQRAGVDLG